MLLDTQDKGFPKSKPTTVPIVVTGAVLSVDLTVIGLIHVHSVRIEGQHPLCARPCSLCGRVWFLLF